MADVSGKFNRKFSRWLPLAWCLLTVLLSTFAYWYARDSFAQSLSQQLQQQLPQRLELALQNRLVKGGPQAWVVEQLERDLATIPAGGNLGVLEQCRAQVTQLVSDPVLPAADRGGQISVLWHFGDSDQQERTRLILDCEANWPVLLASQGGLALLLIGCVLLLPLPISSARRAQIRELVQAGIAQKPARHLSAQLEDFNSTQRALFTRLRGQYEQSLALLLGWLAKPEVAALQQEQLSWLDLVLDRGLDGELITEGNGETGLDRALAVARAPAHIQFDCKNFQVLVHGIPIGLSKTPFFYFLWYARRRLDGDDWYLNPPTNRSDRESAESLIALMEDLRGHNKSINDLREHGLRAKTLDQNRNKIRDELVSALGENLAETYLFESRRDMKSGRYSYRLALSPDRIKIV